MKASLPSFPGLWFCLFAQMACGQSPEPISNVAPAAVTPTQVEPGAPAAIAQGELLMRDAIVAIKNHTSVAAKIRHRIDLFGNQLVGSGTYLQQAASPFPLLRLELRIQLADKQSTLQQISDGRFLWVYQELGDQPRLNRLDLERLRQAVVRNEMNAADGDTSMWMAHGGLPQLLEGLAASFQFTSAEQSKLDDLDVWKLEGRWRPQQVTTMLPDQKAAIEAGREPDVAGLPKHLPHKVLITLGAEDFFPYRIEYLRRASQGSATNSLEPEYRPLVIMELFEVKLNAAIDERQFVYQPGNLEFVDSTNQVLHELRGNDSAAK